MEEGILVGLLLVMWGVFLLVAVRFLPNFSLVDSKKKSVRPVVAPKKKSVATSCVLEARDANDEYRFNFRRARWGMDREQVRASEDSMPVPTKDNSTLAYTSRLGYLHCLITYHMGGTGELVGGRYTFTDTYEDGHRYLKDFDTLLGLYNDRFGEPVQVNEVWHNTTFEKKKDLHGLAFIERHMARRAQWQTPRTDVLLSLGHNDEGEVLFFIEYTARCIVYPPLTDPVPEESSLKNSGGSVLPPSRLTVSADGLAIATDAQLQKSSADMAVPLLATGPTTVTVSTTATDR